MPETCKTVKIVAPSPEEQGAYVIINEEDFDPEQHELYEEGAVDAKKAEKEALIARGVELKIGDAEALGKMRIDTLRNAVARAESALKA